MRHLKRTILAGLTWLTAAATLLAGLPQERCLCAVAQGKVTLRDADTELARSCCSRHGLLAETDRSTSSKEVQTTSVHPQTRHSCCCGRHSKSAREPSGQSRLARAKCVRGYVQTNQEATVSTQTKVNNQAGLAISFTAGATTSTALVAPTETISVGHSLSPPLDLVRLLKHLLI
jgi:hypothetical protein